MKKFAIFYRVIFVACLLLGSKLAIAQQVAPTPLTLFIQKLNAEANPQILDARSAEEFELNHIAKAININLQSTNYTQIVAQLNPQKPTFVYSIGNGRSAALAKELRSKGFTEVYELEGGIGSWVGGGQPIFSTAHKGGLSKQAFDDLIASNKIVLVDIGSKYCGACKKVKPILETLRQQYGNNLTILELELEENPSLIASLKTVSSFPYLILYKDGKTVLKKAGIQELSQTLNQALSKIL